MRVCRIQLITWLNNNNMKDKIKYRYGLYYTDGNNAPPHLPA